MFDAAADKRVILSSIGLPYGKVRRRAAVLNRPTLDRRLITAPENNPWIMLDLGGCVTVAEVAVVTDAREAASSLQGLELLMSEDSVLWFRCLPADTSPEPALRWRGANARARFIQLRLRGHGRISIQDLQVMAHQPSRAYLDSVSQALNGQDVWIAETFKNRRDGFFVEIGAADGRQLSNCFTLEHHLGWRGICVEANPNVIDALRANRPSSIVEHLAMGPRSGETVEFIPDGFYGTVKTLATREQVATKSAVSLPTLSLNDLLDKHAAPPVIEFLSIDTEGSEPDIIETFDFNRRRVLVWCIEHNHMGVRKPGLEALFAEHGYRIMDIGIDWLVINESIWDDALPPHPAIAFKGAA